MAFKKPITSADSKIDPRKREMLEKYIAEQYDDPKGDTGFLEVNGGEAIKVKIDMDGFISAPPPRKGEVRSRLSAAEFAPIKQRIIERQASFEDVNIEDLDILSDLSKI